MKLFNKCIFKLVTILDFLVPKNNRQVLISSSGMKHLSGNALAIFDRLVQDDRFLVMHAVYSKGDKNAIKLNTFKGLWFFLRSKHIIGTHGSADFFFFPSSKKNYIQTWHGSPFKLIGLCERNSDHKRVKILKREMEAINFFLTPSALVSNSFIKAFNIDKEKLLPIGSPRNDILLSNKASSLKKQFKAKNIILYAPTFRDWEPVKWFPFNDFCIDTLSSILKKNDAHLLIRGHIKDIENVNIENHDNISVFDEYVCPDINSVLSDIDILITDYSSIYFDYLLLNRPSIFIPYDIDIYEERRGFFYDDYEKIMVGDIVHDFNSFIVAIKNNLNSDSFSDERVKVNHLFNEYQSQDSYNQLVEKTLIN